MTWSLGRLSFFLFFIFFVKTQANVPETVNEQIPSVCECLLIPNCGVCDRFINETECKSAVDCFWRDTTRQNLLAEHSNEFNEPQIVQVADGVYQALGFGLANSILIVGPTGAVVVDTMESVVAARPVFERFARILNGKPIVAIVYTHSHSDHIYGSSVFANYTSIAVYSHKNHPELLRDSSLITGALFPRSQRQFGNYLPTEVNNHINSGIGPDLLYDNETMMGYLPPTILVDDQMHTTIAGLDFIFVNTPGETSDHLFVYLPHLKLGCVGDNIYKAFPNLYSIRGTRARSLRLWFNSIDTILDFNMELFVPSHTGVLLRGDEIHSVLTSYRDAIQYIHDQTVRMLNYGFSTEDIIDRISLPTYLATHPYLQQFYGTVTWGVRAVVDFYLGWFEGRASKLNPLPWREQSQRLVQLAGGTDPAIEKAMVAMKENTVEGLQWALQLTEAILYSQPNHEKARRIASQCMRFLGYQQLSSNGRNYYVSESARYDGHREYGLSDEQAVIAFVRSPVSHYLYNLPIMLNTRTSKDVENLGATFVFTDDDIFTIRIRREIAQIRQYRPGERQEYANLTMYTTTTTFKQFILHQDQLPRFLATGQIVLNPSAVDGGIDLLQLFNSMFDDTFKHIRNSKGGIVISEELVQLLHL